MPYPCGKDQGLCSADLETQLNEFNDTTDNIENHVLDIEGLVRFLQNEVLEAQKDQVHMKLHKQMAQFPPNRPFCVGKLKPEIIPCQAPCNVNLPEHQYAELKEQYYSLQDDYKGKVTEVAALRTDLQKLKDTIDDCEKSNRKMSYECEDMEQEIVELRALLEEGKKSQLEELKDIVIAAKKKFRDAKEELEELRLQGEEQAAELEDYRERYLIANSMVEEQIRIMSIMKLENSRVKEELGLELMKVKKQFQEKLGELTPLIESLKTTQDKLRETQMRHMMAEQSNEGLIKEARQFKEKEKDSNPSTSLDDELELNEKLKLLAKLSEWEINYDEVYEIHKQLKEKLSGLKDELEEAENNLVAKIHEVSQITSEIQNVRDDADRQVFRSKKRCEQSRKKLQKHMIELNVAMKENKELDQQAQRERNQLREKMLAQIINLSENFEDAQLRIRTLQGQIDIMQNLQFFAKPEETVYCTCAEST